MKYWPIIPLSILVIIATIQSIYDHHRQEQHQKQLLHTGKWTSGYILDAYTVTNRNSGRDVFVIYLYNIDGTRYRRETHRSNLSADAYRTYITKDFPVIYDPANPQESEIMVSPDDFNTYQRAIPDSLSWIAEFVDESF